MAECRARRRMIRKASTVLLSSVLACMFVSAERGSKGEGSSHVSTQTSEPHYFLRLADLLWHSNGSGYQHVWPEMKFGWQVVVGTIIGFVGAAAGSIGGVGGGGVFVPMFTIIMGFDSKSAAAMSKCMIMGAAASTVYHNLKLRHPTLDMPIIDYDLALLLQPMLMLGISIGVIFNVIFADWMVTLLLIFLCLGISTKAFSRGIDMWRKETTMKQEAAKHLEADVTGGEEAEYKFLPGGPTNDTRNEINPAEPEVTILNNVCWKELGLLIFVWFSFLILQIAKNYTATCSIAYWVLNLFQIPVAVGVFSYEAIGLYSGRRVVASSGNASTNLKLHQLVLYCLLGVFAGIVAGLLGVGGGAIMGPLFLEMGAPPQVSSATASFAMAFSSSMSVVEYYLLNRFPVPYAIYFILVAIVAAFIGQRLITKLISILGRASLIIFTLASIIFLSAFSLGGIGILNVIGKIERKEYMGFENLCKSDAYFLPPLFAC